MLYAISKKEQYKAAIAGLISQSARTEEEKSPEALHSITTEALMACLPWYSIKAKKQKENERNKMARQLNAVAKIREAFYGRD